MQAKAEEDCKIRPVQLLDQIPNDEPDTQRA